MKKAPILFAAVSLLALGACGQGEDVEMAGNDPGLADPGVYDTTQPQMDGAAPDGQMASAGTPAPGDVQTSSAAPMPDVLTGNILEVASGAGEFTTLMNLVREAGLTAKLEGPGPFTVFAPTDEAFAALPEGTAEELMQPQNRDDLVALLEYHILPARVTSADISTDVPAPATVEGRSLMLEPAEDGSVMAGDATVVTPDIAASNGVIHVIDKVLTLPEE